MLRQIFERLAGTLTTLVLSSFVIFSSLFLAPGDTASYLLRGRAVSPEALEAIRRQYRLDDPFLVQYVNWIRGIVSGDMGQSTQFRQDVAELLAARAPTTLLLIVYSGLIVVVVGLILGTIAATRGGIVDKIVLIGTSIATATPSFVAAIFLMGFLSVQLGWFPTFGNGEGLVDRLYHLTLPAIALGFTLLGLLARVTRASMMNTMQLEHVEVARSRGLPERTVTRRHILRNSLGPILTVTGAMISALLVSTVIVETAFGLSGLGSLLVQGVTARDFPVVQAIALLGVVIFVISNLVLDLLYPLIDPRIKLGKVARA
jgi:peptide/nickel transport system permease protein